MKSFQTMKQGKLMRVCDKKDVDTKIDELEKRIKFLESQKTLFYAVSYYAIADMRHVGCRLSDSKEKMYEQLQEKFSVHHTALLEVLETEQEI